MKPSILVIDDSKKTRRQVVDTLKKAELFGFIHEAANGIEGFKIALEKSPDIILCDIELPGMNGFKLLSLLNTWKELQGIPVIVITGRVDPETKIRALGLGASDYITKPFIPGELLARVKVQLKAKSLQDRLRESNERLLELSRTDPLTGLYNRRQMIETLEKEMDRSKREGNPLSLILIDVDHFKKINDAFGHQQGDLVLKNLSRIFRQHLRQYDSVARIGGEEFTLILPATGLAEARDIAERLRDEVSKMVNDDNEAKRVTISLGVASYTPGREKTPDNLLRKADEALYRAKQEGRNRVVADLNGAGDFTPP